MEFIYFLILLFGLTLFLQWYMDYPYDENFGSVQKHYSESSDGTQDINLTVNNDSEGYVQPWYSSYYPSWYSPWYMPTRGWNRHVFYPYVYDYYSRYNGGYYRGYNRGYY